MDYIQSRLSIKSCLEKKILKSMHKIKWSAYNVVKGNKEGTKKIKKNLKKVLTF